MIEVIYKCRCMANEAAVDVAERRSDEDVVFWLEQVVGSALAADHAARSPLCMAVATEYVKIPAPENAPYLGGRPELHS